MWERVSDIVEALACLGLGFSGWKPGQEKGSDLSGVRQSRETAMPEFVLRNFDGGRRVGK